MTGERRGAGQCRDDEAARSARLAASADAFRALLAPLRTLEARGVAPVVIFAVSDAEPSP